LFLVFLLMLALPQGLITPKPVAAQGNLWRVFPGGRVSIASNGAQANVPGRSGILGPRISADGRFIAFSSSASNLVPGDTNNTTDVFIYDRDVDGNGIFDEPGGIRTSRVSVTSNGIEGNAASFVPSINVDGRFVAFTSAASNLVAGDTHNEIDVFVAAGFAQCSHGDLTDTDGDGLLDGWETGAQCVNNPGKPGIDFDGDGTCDIILCVDANNNGLFDPGECADPRHKDIFVEIDFMALHQPNANAINDVVAAFAAAPAASVMNPDGTRGIRLHVQVNEQAVPHKNNLAFVPCTSPGPAGTPAFDAVKRARFGTPAERAKANSANILAAKRLAFHYVLFAHSLVGKGTTSGCAELPGTAVVVSLGGWTVVGGHDVGNRDEQAGTLMHELGHNFKKSGFALKH
jgi:hypothetical protein